MTPLLADAMPKIVSPGSGYSAVLTASGAHDYHLIGLEVTKQTATAVVYDLIALGDGSSAQRPPAGGDDPRERL